MAEITCCTGQTECNHLITIGYLKNFIGTNIKNTGGTTVYVNTSKSDSYVPTYAELTGGTLVPQFVDGGNNKWHSSIDGITVNGTYAQNEGVEQSDLVLTYTRFKSLSISAGKTTFDECSDSTDITATYKLTKTVKAMNNCVAAESSSEGSDTTCKPSFSGSCNWLTLGSCSSNKITASAGKNGDWSAPQRSCNVKTTVTYKGQTYTSNTITITQEALTGSYSVYEGRHYTATTITSHDDLTQNTCSGATVTASATAYYYDRYKWKDSCGKVYEYNYDDRYSSESAGSASHTFDPVYCPTESQTDTYVMTITYQSHSDSVTFYQVCQQNPPCEKCEDFNTYGSCNVTEYVDACGGDVTLSCSIPTTIHHKGWDGMGHCIETGTTETAYTQTATITIPENKIQGGPGATSSHTGSITTEEGGVINYTIIQDISNPCGGCGEEFSSFTFSDVSVNCSAHTNEEVSVPYTLTKSYSVTACADVVESDYSSFTINIDSCNETTAIKDYIFGGELGNFTVHQAAGNGACCCSCEDFALSTNSLSWAWNNTSSQSNSYVLGNCITDITATSDNNWFSVSVASNSINVAPSNNNTTLTAKTGTITVSYKAHGSDCTSKTFTVSQDPYGCTCDDLTIGSAPSAWAWNETTAKTVSYTANSTCISNVSVSSDTTAFTTSVNTSTKVITVTPAGQNATTTSKVGTITLSYTSEGNPTCHKTFTVSQDPYGCTCSDLTLGSAPSEWAWTETAAKTVSYTANSICIGSVSVSSDTTAFTTSVNTSTKVITVTPAGQNTSTSAKNGIITLSYTTDGNDCSSSFTVTQRANTCSCNDLTVTSTPAAWEWDDLSQKTASFSFNNVCITNISINVTGSSSTAFTVTSALTTSSGTITIKPNDSNTSATASRIATVVINYKSNNIDCNESFVITQKSQGCSCEDITFTGATSIPDSGGSPVEVISFTPERGCFDTFSGDSSDTWITVLPYTSGNKLYASVNSNTSCSTRTGTITFKYGSGGTYTCTEQISVTQNAHTCTCSDITFNVTKTALDACGASTKQQIGTYSTNCATCIDLALSTGGTFAGLAVTFENGKIYATYPTTASAKSGTLILKYGGSNCSTINMSQASCCNCETDLTINTTPSQWNWNETTAKTATFSFASSCMTSSDITVSVTGSSSSWFTVTSAISSSNGTITITPSGQNSTLTAKTATVIVKGKINGVDCSKSFIITHKSQQCTCDDMTVTPSTSAIPASGSSAIQLATFTVGRGCFDTFDASDDANWLTVYPIQTSSNAIGASVDSNSTCEPRTATITFKYGSGGTTSCTTSFTVTQEAHSCSCSDITFNITKTSLDCGGATNQQIGTYAYNCATCSKSSLSKAGTFSNLTVTFDNGIIYATYPAATSVKSGTLILKYGGSNCATYTLTQTKCCSCENDLTINTTPSEWAWNETSSKTGSYSFDNVCMTITGVSSSNNWFSVSNSVSTSTGTVTVTPSGTTTTEQTATITVSGTLLNGSTCSKTFTVKQNKPPKCNCTNITFTKQS